MNWAILIAIAASAAYQKANTLFLARNFSEALTATEALLRIDRRLLPALILKAKLAMAAKRYPAARDTLEQAIALYPSAAYPRFLYGLQFYLANDLPNALPQFSQAWRMNPRDARAAQYLGLTTESLGRPLEALALYQQAAVLAPKADILLNAARLLYLLDRLPECGQWIDRALAAEPDSRDAHFEKARWLLKLGEPERALSEAQTALKCPPGDTTDSQIQYLLARAGRSLRNPR